MDTFTLIAASRLIETEGVRAAARSLSCPPATIAAALDRLESRLAVTIAARAGRQLALTLEGRRLASDLSVAASLAIKLGLAATPAGQTAPGRPPTIALRSLERFLWVAKAGSIRRAAGEMGIGQPQLSRQISHLEQQIGAPLLLRSIDGIALTAIGTDVLRLAEELGDIWRQLTSRAEVQFRRTQSTLRLGSIMPLGHESAVARLLGDLAARWRRTNAATPLFISSTTAQELMMGLQKGTYDLALLDTSALPANLEQRTITTAPLALVGHADLVRDQGDDVAGLLKAAPIAATSLKSGLRQRLEQLFRDTLRDAEIERLALLEIDSLPIIISLILHHGYIGVLPRSAIETLKAPVVAIPLDPRYDIPLILAWSATPSARKAATSVMTMLDVIAAGKA